MNIVNGILAQPKQQFNLTLENGSTVAMYLEYNSQQQGWFFDIAWGSTFLIYGLRLVSSPNMLRQYRNAIPFGLAALSKNNVEPTTLDSLSDGTTTVYLLNAADVALVETLSFGA